MTRLARGYAWTLLALLVLAQIGYPLTAGTTRARLTVATVVLGYLLSVGHALLSRGTRTALALVALATGGGLAIEALGVATGFPFGSYDYSGQLGPKLAGVPLIIPLAWTWMAWPAWLVATRLVKRWPGRIALATLGLATWDLFLDPQMVAEGHWVWRDAEPALPGLPGIPVSNYLGWLLFAVLVMTALRPLAGPAVADTDARDHPLYALYLWTYGGSVLAHAVFLDLPASAVWGAAGMALVAVPLAVTLLRERRHRDRDTGPARPPERSTEADRPPADAAT
ncbi:carotenoid biosynthesis protein [Micromonospora endophytica]|uniref:Carotenoid biosynthesis protein n=1 Tax=Micromonospora endophytica TaxID=515350 RepID=A0A2W2D3R9_9ACTN|nr:carotenoid biosynthesis protein [Micromonospora endophytica]PZF91926.1 carotenoid biosynthesis protein [Micromonospora endophytica]RIW48529.1 carotenoid biosynthesis protein [Micromonospora endophytica]BCJ61135.1 membrane protein [Micromonospora endophytica]